MMKTRVLAVMIVAMAGISYALIASHQHSVPSREAGGAALVWTPYSAEALKGAIAAHKPVFIDFYADWCPGCHILDQTVFSNPNIIKRLSAFTALRVDATQMNSPQVQELFEQYGIYGLPTIVFLDDQGHEIKNARIEGAGAAEDFDQILDALDQKGS